MLTTRKVLQLESNINIRDNVTWLVARQGLADVRFQEGLDEGIIKGRRRVATGGMLRSGRGRDCE